MLVARASPFPGPWARAGPAIRPGSKDRALHIVLAVRAKAGYVLENLAAEYYEEAVQSFLGAGQADGGSCRVDQVTSVDRKLRLCTLLSALAAEAYANAFLEFALGSQQASDLDRNPTSRKFVLGPGHAGCGKSLDLGRAPLQLVAELFKRRDAIVHARPRRVRINEYGVRQDAGLCARSLIAVADCVLVLNGCLEETSFMGPIERMYDLGDEIDPDWEMIDAERMYFFTGGLVHVIAKERGGVQALGDEIQRDPFADRHLSAPPDYVARGRELERKLEPMPSR